MAIKMFWRLLWYQYQIIVNKQLLVCLGLLVLLPLMVSFQGIELEQGAMVTEIYVSLIGLILIGTVSLPEADSDFADLLRSQFISLGEIWILRVFVEMLLTIFFMSAWVLVLKHFNHQIPVLTFIFGGVSAAFLWGAIAATVAIISRNTYTGILVTLVILFYIIFGMNKRLSFYPLGLLINPNRIQVSTVVTLIGSACLLFGALVYNYCRELNR